MSKKWRWIVQGPKKSTSRTTGALYIGQMPRQLLHELLLKLLLISSLDDLFSSFHRRLCERLTSSQLTNRAGFVKLLLKTLQRFID